LERKDSGDKKMGTEIHTFKTLKEMTEMIQDQISEQKALFEDYSQWLGSLLRTCGEDHNDEEWFKKCAALQKNLEGQSKKTSESKNSSKKGGKNKGSESSCWVQSGIVMLSSVEQGQVELLFEAIEKINSKIVELDKFKATLQQLERIGLGKSVNYLVYIEEDIPKKIVIRQTGGKSEEVSFKFAAELSIPAVFKDFVN
jgi:prefoldin subunit 5